MAACVYAFLVPLSLYLLLVMLMQYSPSMTSLVTENPERMRGSFPRNALYYIRTGLFSHGTDLKIGEHLRATLDLISFVYGQSCKFHTAHN
jgi:hypothetical protein